MAFHLSHAQRSAAAKKAALTRKEEGITPFSHDKAKKTATNAKPSSHTINPHIHHAGRLAQEAHHHLGHIRRHHSVGYHQHLIRHRVTSKHGQPLGGHVAHLGEALNPYELSRKQPVRLNTTMRSPTPKRPTNRGLVSRNPHRLTAHRNR